MTVATWLSMCDLRGRAELVVIGAHPLDAEILGGAVAAQLARRGGRGVLVHVTDGAGNYPALGVKGSRERVRHEAERAAELLGSDLCWLGFPSGDLRAGAPFRAALARLLQTWQPHAVITHWRGSWHERHRITHRLVLSAIATAGIPTHVYFGENFEDLEGFHPTLYIDISDVCARWWQALESHGLYRESRSIAPTDQATFPYSAYYRAAPRVRGLEIGLPLAQAFVVHGVRGRRRLVRHLP